MTNLSIYYFEKLKNYYQNFPLAKLMFSNNLFSPKPKDILFT